MHLYSPERFRQEQARLAREALIIDKYGWRGPQPCLGCQYFYGQQGINCAPHPSGPAQASCPDWSGVLSTSEALYQYLEGQGWTQRIYEPGQGYRMLQIQLTPEQVSEMLGIAEFY